MNNDQLFQLKSLGGTPDSELLLLYLLGQYQTQSQNAYLETSDLLFLDLDSSKLYRALNGLKERGALDFQASSLELSWANANEEDRLDLAQIQQQLSSGILTGEQAFYYELLLQKTPGQSVQVVDIYNWTGVEDYSAVEITALAYDWSLKTTKFTAYSNDWLIFWEQDFSFFSFSVASALTPARAPILAFATSSGSISANSEVSWSFEGLEPGSSYRIDMLGPDATATSGQTVNIRIFPADSLGRIGLTTRAASGEEYSPGNRGAGTYRLALFDDGQIVVSTEIIVISP